MKFRQKTNEIFRVRLLGYDAQEIKQRKTEKNRILYKQMALKARDKLRDEVLSRYVEIEAVKLDSFGRILA